MSTYPTPSTPPRLTLSPEILALTEQLAENARDLWAAQRLADGWREGAR